MNVPGLAVVVFFAVSSLGFELTLDPDELVRVQKPSGSACCIFGGLGFQHQRAAAMNRTLLVIRDHLYGPWSNWSGCSHNTCLQHRFRRCIDESYLRPVHYESSFKSFCSFKYLAEERPCTNRSQCVDDAEPPEQLLRMQDVCGNREAFSVGDFNETLSQYDDSRDNGGYVDHEEVEEEDDDRYESRKFNNTAHGRFREGRRDNVTAKAWPWHVAIHKAITHNYSNGSTSRLNTEDIICSGTLLTPRWVLTAAHCLKSFFFSRRIPFGVPTILSEITPTSLLVRVNDSGRESDYVGESVIIHPDWEPMVVNSAFDIAMIKLRDSVDFRNGNGSGAAAPVACLPRKNVTFPLRDTTCYTVGWSANNEAQQQRRPTALFDYWFSLVVYVQPIEPQTAKLHEIKVKVEPLQNCFYHGEEEKHFQICASKSNGCARNSGAGLYCQDKATRRWFIYGVLTSGYQNSCPNRRWLYNSLDSVSKWIYHNIK